jgi:GTP-binding protein LepA
MENIRNFSIIAHIDHGKSTLADRLIQYTGVCNERNFQDQLLDNMDIERERVSIKSNAISLPYRAQNGQTYTLNLIDTPGQSIFPRSFPVACFLRRELLLIDAAQGVHPTRKPVPRDGAQSGGHQSSTNRLPSPTSTAC